MIDIICDWQSKFTIIDGEIFGTESNIGDYLYNHIGTPDNCHSLKHEKEENYVFNIFKEKIQGV